MVEEQRIGNQYRSTLHQEHPHPQFTLFLLHQGHHLCQPRQSLFQLNLLGNIVLVDKSINLVYGGLLRRNGKWNMSQDVGEDSQPWSTNQVVKRSHSLHQQHRVAINEGLAAFRQGAGMRKRREPRERENARNMRIDSLESLDSSRKHVIELFVLHLKKGGGLSQQREQEDVDNGRKKRDIEGKTKLGDVKKRKKRDIEGETKLGDVKKRKRDIEEETKLGDVKKRKRDIEGETKLGDVKKRKRDIEEETKLGDVKKRQTERDSDSNTGWQSKSVLVGCAEPTYLANLAISPQYTRRVLMSEGIVSFARLGRYKERGGCHRPPLEDMMEASWGGVTPSMVVSVDAGVGRVRNGSQSD